MICDVPNMAVFCRESNECCPGIIIIIIIIIIIKNCIELFYVDFWTFLKLKCFLEGAFSIREIV
jgi:hypothetical protein